MNVEVYNFRKPGPLATDLENRLAAWLRGACGLAPERWPRHLPIPLETAFRGVDTVRPADGLARLSDTALGYRVTLSAVGMNTLLILPRPLVLALVAAAQGDAAGELPGDRALTVVEDALAEYLVSHLLLAVFQEAWPGSEPVTLALAQKEEEPKRSRVFAPDQNVVVCLFSLSGPFGAQEWHWMLPQAALLEQLAKAGQVAETGQEAEARPRLEVLVRQFPVQLSVSLGAVELPIALLARLRPGDVVVLNQRVHEPLIASVGPERRFRVWPGRVGPQQAFQVESLVES
jgi:flagellar motor switch protein FliM